MLYPCRILLNVDPIATIVAMPKESLRDIRRPTDLETGRRPTASSPPTCYCGVGVAVGSGVGVDSGVAVGSGVAVASGVGVAVGSGAGVAVASGVGVRVGVGIVPDLISFAFRSFGVDD